MKNTFILLCIFFLASTVSGQMHTSIDVVGSYDPVNNVHFNFGGTSHGNRTGYRIGGNFNFRIFEQVFIKTGTRFVRQGNDMLFVVPGAFLYREYVDEYYIEIPLSIRYEFSNRKVSLYGEVGMSPHIYLKGKLTQERDQMITSNDYEIPYLKDRRIRLAIVFGIGMNINLSNHFQVFIQPTYRYFLGPNNSLGSIAGATNLGVEVGVRKAISFVKEDEK